MTYQTTPGTIPHRVVEHLRTLPPGTQLTAGQLGDALDVDPSLLRKCLLVPVMRGMIATVQSPADKRRLLYSLGYGVTGKLADAPSKPAGVAPSVFAVPPASAPEAKADHTDDSAKMPFGATEVTSDIINCVCGYSSLADVLNRAFDQAARGKGAQRHAQGQAFNRQPMQDLIRLHGVGFATGQASKKAQESHRLPRSHAVAELLGAINYLAGAIIAIEAGDTSHAAD